MTNDDTLTPEEKFLRRKSAISTAPSANLAAYVVVYKTLGIDKDFAILCMEELAKRRAEGDDFDFENFIAQEAKKIPKIETIDILKISRDIMSNVESLDSVLKSANSLKSKIQK